MFKLVVLFSAVCALAAGKPGALFAAPFAAPLALPLGTSYVSPLAYSSTFYSPATITKTGTVLQSAPILQTPTIISGSHFIKKRSAITPFTYSPAVVAPAAYSSQSRLDFPAKTIYTAAGPLITHFSGPLAYTHY